VFRGLVWTLRQRRYAGLAVAGLVVALICVAMGTFEIHRYNEKTHDNRALRSNAHAAVAPLTTSLVPLAGRGRAPSADAIRYRHVSVTGRYLADREQYLANETQGGRQGFHVVTPLRSGGVVLLVVRGFVAATNDETRPAHVPAAPAGLVHLTGWLETTSETNDQLGRLGHDEIMSINPSEQAGRLRSPVYQASLTLTAHQPGTAGLTAVPLPGLGNPSGGAAQWQLLSYVVQWYAFAVLAMLVPFLVSRAEVKDARRRFLGIDDDARQLDAEPGPDETAGRASPGGELVARSRGELARRMQIAARVERAARLADRYGRSLGIDAEDALAAAPAAPPPSARRPVVRDSSTAAHRSADEYHASYNDYLWELALADGGLPDLAEDGVQPARIDHDPDRGDDDDDSASDGGVPVP